MNRTLTQKPCLLKCFLWSRQISQTMHPTTKSTNLEGVMIYSKGKLVHEAGIDTYYFLISSKKAV